MESTKRYLSLLLPILEKLSKFSQNYKFREVFSKQGASFFQGGAKFLTCRGKISSGGKQVQGGTPLPLPVEESQNSKNKIKYVGKSNV